MNDIDFSCLSIGPDKPRVIVVGKELDASVRSHLFNNDVRRISPLIETYGFGKLSTRYDNWLPGEDEKHWFSRDIFYLDPRKKGEPYKFDLAVLHLDNWKDYKDSKKLTSRCPDPYNLLTWCLDRLNIDAPIIITGEEMFFIEIIGSISYRLSNVHCMRRGQSSKVAIIAQKKSSPTRDDICKKQVSAFFNRLSEKDFGFHLAGNAAFSFIPPTKGTYTIQRNTKEEPTCLSRFHDKNYIARAMEKANMSHPFEPLRARYAEKSRDRRVRLPMEPPLGQIAKLATLADGPIVNEDGNIVVIKGTAETVPAYDARTKETRYIKRQTMITIQMNGPKKGRLERFVLG